MSNTYCAENVAPPSTGEAILSQQQQNQNEKQNKLKEMATAMLESASYQNIYFHRCKSYKKATKLSDLDFEFDFTMFDSHHPYYPSALEDINTKINKTNSFWKSILWFSDELYVKKRQRMLNTSFPIYIYIFFL